MAFFISDSLELAGAPLWHVGTRRPPVGRLVPLARGREIFVREAAPSAHHPSLSARRLEAPPVLLLHGWLASGGLNWLRAFEPLSKRHRVCAPDLHGHAGSDTSKDPEAFRGFPLDAERHFEIERCADDIAELLDVLYPGEPALVVGYSLGGMVAQALWRRHPRVVRGLVLGATSAAPVPRSRGRRPFAGLMNAARESSLLFERLTHRPRSWASSAADAIPNRLGAHVRQNPLGHWAPSEFARHHWPTVLDAGRAIAEFDARGWIGELDVPASIILTERDSLIPPAQQHAMARAIGHAHLQLVDAGHFACLRADFGSRLLSACKAVETGRSELA